MRTMEFAFVRALRSTLRFPSRSRVRPRLLPEVVVLEARLPLSTYTWSAGGDGMTWNDPDNWRHYSRAQRAQVPGTPTAYSDVVFPSQAILPAGFSTTIDFDFTFPVHAARFAHDQRLLHVPRHADHDRAVAFAQ